MTKFEKEKLQLSAGRLWGVHSHARKQRTGSTAKYLYQRKQAAQQLDMGACQGSLLPPHAASSPTGWRSPRATIPAHALLPSGGLTISPAHGSQHSAGPHCPRELALPPSVVKGGEDRFPIGLPQLQTLPGLPQRCKGHDCPAQLSPLLWCPLGLALGLARPAALSLQAGACLIDVPRRGCPLLWSSTCPGLRDL